MTCAHIVLLQSATLRKKIPQKNNYLCHPLHEIAVLVEKVGEK
jgi:hypothetical protein